MILFWVIDFLLSNMTWHNRGLHIILVLIYLTLNIFIHGSLNRTFTLSSLVTSILAVKLFCLLSLILFAAILLLIYLWTTQKFRCTIRRQYQYQSVDIRCAVWNRNYKQDVGGKWIYFIDYCLTASEQYLGHYNTI